MNELTLYPDIDGSTVIVYNKKVYKSFDDIKLPPISKAYFTKFTGIWLRRLATNKRIDIEVTLPGVMLVGAMTMSADYTTHAKG